MIQKNIGFDSYINCFWWVVVTMTTIGYGDYYPRTLSGRLVAFVLCVWGTIMVSLMVVSLESYVRYDRKQKQADFMSKKLNMKQEVRDAAASLIGISWRSYYNYVGRKSVFKNIRFWYNVKKFKTAFTRLKNAKKDLRNHIIECDVFDRFIVENDLLKNDFELMNDKNIEILKGAKQLNSQLKSLMHTQSTEKMSKVLGLKFPEKEKADSAAQSEISLDRFDCIFASNVSGKSHGSDEPRSPLKSTRKPKAIDSDEEIDRELEEGSRYDNMINEDD